MTQITQIPKLAANVNGQGMGIDLAAILALGIERRNAHDPLEAWHNEQDNDAGYHWHASTLSGCPREAVLKRAGKAEDGITLESALTFQIGHLYHNIFELGVQDYENEDFELVATEQGGYHSSLNLAARFDILYRHRGILTIGDYKTESPFAKTKRNAEAREKGQDAPYKWEHRLQLTATAMVAEDTKIVEDKIEAGAVFYIDKSSGAIDQVPVEITYGDRLTVINIVQELDKAWSTYVESGVLPDPLRARDDVWRCAARSDANAKGKYCTARSTCFAYQAQGF